MANAESKYYAPSNGQNINDELDFWAQSVIIDNRTSSYIEIVPARRWIDPGSGAGIPFKATQKAELRWTAPPGKIQIPPVPGEQAQVRFYTNPYPPGIGLVTKQAISGNVANPTVKQLERQVISTSFTTTVVTIPKQGTFAQLGAFNHIRIYMVVNNNGAPTVTLTINGDQTLTYYKDATLGQAGNITNNASGAGSTLAMFEISPPSAANAFAILILDLIEINSFIKSTLLWMQGVPAIGVPNNQGVGQSIGFHNVNAVISNLTLNDTGFFQQGSTFVTYGYP
jgi:hypothetical protein